MKEIEIIRIEIWIRFSKVGADVVVSLADRLPIGVCIQRLKWSNTNSLVEKWQEKVFSFGSHSEQIFPAVSGSFVPSLRPAGKTIFSVLFAPAAVRSVAEELAKTRQFT